MQERHEGNVIDFEQARRKINKPVFKAILDALRYKLLLNLQADAALREKAETILYYAQIGSGEIEADGGPLAIMKAEIAKNVAEIRAGLINNPKDEQDEVNFSLLKIEEQLGRIK